MQRIFPETALDKYVVIFYNELNNISFTKGILRGLCIHILSLMMKPK